MGHVSALERQTKEREGSEWIMVEAHVHNEGGY